MLVALLLHLPLIGFLINGLFGRKLKPTVVSLIACGSVFLSFGITLYLFIQFLSWPESWRVVSATLFEWIPSVGAQYSLRLDSLSILLTLVVTGVGFLIHLYSIGYMSGDKSVSRYFSYLNLFTFSMLLLILADNLLLLFIGWEGVGLCSYLLIGFWFEDSKKAAAGKKAFIVNRIGDLAFLVALFFIFSTFGTFKIESLALFKIPEVILPTLTLITLLLFVGACGKSAQIPLFVWLPDAMAGPTPVSALIHAATMVTAGVYMIARLHFWYVLTPISSTVVVVVGLLTMLLAASIALFQNDIKKVLAYSTISQLGYMFIAVGVGAFTAGIFHLITHAFFKALLFLAAGSVIHSLHHEQDIQKMGRLYKKLPLTHIAFLVGTLAIIGFPPFSGFFSKDEILWKAFNFHPMLWFLAWAGALMTAFYMVRLFTLTFYGTPKADHSKVCDAPPTMAIALGVLALLSIGGGLIGIPHVFHAIIPLNHFLDHFLSPLFTQSLATHASLSTEMGLMGLAIVSTFLVGGFTFYTFHKNTEWAVHIKLKFTKLHKIISDKYYVDEFYNQTFVKPINQLSTWLLKWGDFYIIEGIVNGLAKLNINLSGRLTALQNGHLQTYAFSFVIGILVIFLYYWNIF